MGCILSRPSWRSAPPAKTRVSGSTSTRACAPACGGAAAADAARRPAHVLLLLRRPATKMVAARLRCTPSRAPGHEPNWHNITDGHFTIAWAPGWGRPVGQVPAAGGSWACVFVRLRPSPSVTVIAHREVHGILTGRLPPAGSAAVMADSGLPDLARFACSPADPEPGADRSTQTCVYTRASKPADLRVPLYHHPDLTSAPPHSSMGNRCCLVPATESA